MGGPSSHGRKGDRRVVIAGGDESQRTNLRTSERLPACLAARALAVGIDRSSKRRWWCHGVQFRLYIGYCPTYMMYASLELKSFHPPSDPPWAPNLFFF
jgi:hypothetical protein